MTTSYATADAAVANFATKVHQLEQRLATVLEQARSAAAAADRYRERHQPIGDTVEEQARLESEGESDVWRALHRRNLHLVADFEAVAGQLRESIEAIEAARHR